MDNEFTARMGNLTADQRLKFEGMRDQLIAIMGADKARREKAIKSADVVAVTDGLSDETKACLDELMSEPDEDVRIVFVMRVERLADYALA